MARSTPPPPNRPEMASPAGSPPDSALGELFAFAVERQSLPPFRVLIRSSNWLGDAVMTVPAVRAIKRARPGTHVTVLTPEKLGDVWKLVSEVDEVIPFPGAHGSGLARTFHGVLQIFKVAKLIRGRGFDAAVMFPNSVRTGLEAWLAKIPRRIAYAGHAPRRMFLTEVVPAATFSGKDRATEPPGHQVRGYLKIAEFLGASIGDEPGFGFPDAGIRAAGRDMSPVRIAVCAGAEYGPAKRWLPERFAEVIRSIGESTDCRWHLVGTAKDRAVAEEIATLAGNPGYLENLCGGTTLAELIALLRGCRLVLTNDTGTMHLAALLGVQTVSIFGSTEPRLTGPLGRGHVVLRRQVECSPCFLRDCPLDFRCMRAIETAQVVAAIRSVLAPKK